MIMSSQQDTPEKECLKRKYAGLTGQNNSRCPAISTGERFSFILHSHSNATTTKESLQEATPPPITDPNPVMDPKRLKTTSQPCKPLLTLSECVVSNKQLAAQASTASLSTILAIITQTRYPILRELLPHLNQYDLSSLRATCKTLRANLPATSTLLGGCCPATEHRSFQGDKNLRLHACPGYTAPGLESIVIHKNPFWICGPCVCQGIEDTQAHILTNFRQYKIEDPVHNTSIARYLPICSKCFDSANGKSSTPIDTKVLGDGILGPCSCVTALARDILLSWYCSECALRMAQEELERKIMQASESYNNLLKDLDMDREFICLKCECVAPAEEEQGYYMCAGCEDLEIREDFEKVKVCREIYAGLLVVDKDMARFEEPLTQQSIIQRLIDFGKRLVDQL